VDNFRKAACLMKGAFQGRRFNDSDVFKAMEGAGEMEVWFPRK
jgi:hypothetical protein